MGQVNLTNLTGTPVTIGKFEINGDLIAQNGTSIGSGNTLEGRYSNKDWNGFEDLILDVNLNDQSYHVNLNRSHYFGGGDYHYPGSGSDVNYVLLGLNSSGSKVVMMEAYRQEGAAYFLHDGDHKNLDRK